MELTKKKEITLRKVFLKFLLQLAAFWVLILVLWLALLEFALYTGFLLPSNAIERQVSDWIDTHTNISAFSEIDLPADADYACYAADGTLLWSNLTDKAKRNADLLMTSPDLGSQYLSYPYTYVKVNSDSQTLILVYPVRATFASAGLRRLFPSAEPFLLVGLLLLLLGSLIFFVLSYAKKLSTELSVLEYTSEQIRAKNLDFEVSQTGIAEFNHVLSSLLMLRSELRHSLEQQWNSEQQKKNQMSALAHDIKTPLTVVKGNAELLSETELTDEQQDYNAFILENTAQIQTYVTKMLEISRPAPAKASSCHLPMLLEQIKKTAESLCAGKNISFHLVTENLPQNVALPEETLKRSLLNPLDNAVTYSPAHGTVTLRVWQTSDTTGIPSMLCFCITDEGIGFSSEALMHATDEFYRSDNSRCSHEHFGLGLAITKSLVGEQGGTLELSNRPSGGACVTLKFPINQAHAPQSPLHP